MKAKESKYIKVGAVSPRIRLGDVDHNVKECIKEAKKASEAGARVLAFPELTLTGATCGDMFSYTVLSEKATRGLCEFVEATKTLDMISFIGLPMPVEEEVFSCTAVVYMGDVLLVTSKSHLDGEEEKYFSHPDRPVRKITFDKYTTDMVAYPIILAPFDKKIKISVGLDISLSSKANLSVVPVACPTDIEMKDIRLNRARLISGATGHAFVFADAGVGESTTDYVYCAHNIIADRGQILATAEPFASDNLIIADVRVDKPTPDKDAERELNEEADRLTVVESLPLNPFLPTDAEKEREACLFALEIQAQGLAARVERSYSKAMVIGVSGGLDSTLALLVCARAADILGMDRKSIIGVTMPCFGTTKRTKSNAEKLCDALGVSFRTVDIKASVTQHLADIGHDGVTTDVTYENAQARERTQVIMDIANMTGGLVVGTGDLSELALGWATYNGDHMSMYAVNGSVPKTMVRRITEVYSECDRQCGGACCDILDDILATPVSPELLPPKDGEIAQCTEQLVGPYELHDYFLYCTLECRFSPCDIYELAKETFEGVYDNKTILAWLRVFARRFFNQQFKRSCLPDGPKVSCISVSPRGGLKMPSDMSSAAWLAEIDEIEKTELN